MDMGTIGAAVSSLKAAKDIAQALLSIKTEAEMQTRVIELQSIILDAQGKALDAQSEQFELVKQIAELEQKLQQLMNQKEFISTLERSEGMYFSAGDEEPFCSRCVEVDSRSVHLSKTTNIDKGHRVWQCPQCKSSYAK